MTDQEREMLTIAEAATVAGYSPRTIRNYITRGLLPAYRSVGGRKIRIKRADVDALFVLIPVNPEQS